MSTLTPAQVVTEQVFGILVGTLKNHSVAVKAEKFLATDVSVTLAGVSANSTNGGTVTLSNGLVTYTPATNFIGADLFTYVVNDGSTSATGSVQVIVADTGARAPNSIGAVVVESQTERTHASRASPASRIPSSARRMELIGLPSAVPSSPLTACSSFSTVHRLPGAVFYRTTAP